MKRIGDLSEISDPCSFGTQLYVGKLEYIIQFFGFFLTLLLCDLMTQEVHSTYCKAISGYCVWTRINEKQICSLSDRLRKVK